jgi:hypothetical protein
MLKGDGCMLCFEIGVVMNVCDEYVFKVQHGDTCNILVLIESCIMISYVCFPKKARIWFDCVSQIGIYFPFDYVG